VAGAYLPADIVARYHRLAGDDVLFVSGSDQHGTPITVAAEREGVPPHVFADRQHERIAASFERLGISFDRYTRTGTALHADVVQRLFCRLVDRGFVTEGQERAAFCPREHRSLPDRYVVGSCPRCGRADARGDQCDGCGSTLDPDQLVSPTCRRCGAAATFRPLRQLFLRLDLLQARVERFVRDAGAGWRPFVAAEARGWLREGLRPRAITRDLEHGVPVPLPAWDDRRLYVWFDAVIGYLSASIEWARETGDADAWRAWWQEPDAVHRYFVGKDNVPFHALWWPAILAGAGGLAPGEAPLHLPEDVVANHYLTLGGEQFSASRGHGFGLDEALDAAGVDPIRHALAATNPETADTEFDWARTAELTRTGLLGAIANPAFRVATLLWTRIGGRVETAAWEGSARPDRDAAALALATIGDHLRAARIRAAVDRIHDLGRTVNRRLADTEPWRLPDAELAKELTAVLPYLDALGIAAWPVVPTTAGRIRTLLGRPANPSVWALDPAPPIVRRVPEPPLERASDAAGGLAGTPVA
jgi:methionyl-tRNA synthetase